VKIGGRWLTKRGLGGASIGWILEDGVVQGVESISEIKFLDTAIWL